MIKFASAHKKFVDHLSGLGRSSSTLIAYGKDIEQLLEYLSKKGLSMVHEIELGHLEEFMTKLANEEYTPKSISRKTNSTKTFFKFLDSENFIEVNVAEMLKHPKVEIKPPRILSELEYRALRDVARDDHRTFAIIEVLLQTGVTISELANIQINHLNMEGDNMSLFVPQKNAKDERRVPLNKAVVDAVKRYIEHARPKDKESDYLFVTKTGNALLVRNIRSTLDRFFKSAGIENVKVNDLRHTFVAHHLMKGTSLVYLSKIVGHKRVSTTERYLQYIDKKSSDEKSELGVL